MSMASFWMIAGIYASFAYFGSTFTIGIAAHLQDLRFSPDGANVSAMISAGSVIAGSDTGLVEDGINLLRFRSSRP